MNPGEYHFQNPQGVKQEVMDSIVPCLEVFPGILNNVINTDSGGRRKTVLLSGPTGGGKTSLLNSLLGFSLFPEGCGQKTQVPTVIIRGESFELKALGRLGRPLSKIPILRLKESQVVAGFPTKAETILLRLERGRKKDTKEDLTHRWETFWKPVVKAAETGKCFCVKATLPARWLPDSISLVDLPGYAGWLKDESPAVHRLHTTLMESAAATIFVFKPEQLKRAHGPEYLGCQIKNDRRVSLLVNEMDGFNPYQVPEMLNCEGPPPFESAWSGYCKHVWTLLSNGYGWTIDNDHADIFFGASRLNRQIQHKWHLSRILSEMMLFYRALKTMISAAGKNL